MKTLFIMISVCLSFSLSPIALGWCHGSPILEKHEKEKISCGQFHNKNSCVEILGCEWTPEVAKVMVCNKTDKKIGVAYQFANLSQDWATDEGWMVLAAGACQDKEAPRTERFSVFAISEKGHFYWYGEGPTMCFDPQGQKYEVDRRLSENSCGNLTGIGAYQSITLQPDDHKRIDIQGPGADLSPAPPVFEPTYAALAVGYCRGTSEYFYSYGETQEESKSMMMGNCGRTCNSCELGLLTEPGKPTCVAILKGPEPFLAWGWAYNPKEAPFGRDTAVNNGLSECQKKGQACLVATVFCNDEVVTP